MGPRIEEMIGKGVSAAKACASLGVAPATYYRWRKASHAQDGKAPPRRRDTDSTREIVENAAKDVFLAQGFAASIESIAQAAGVARRTIYNLYDDKTAFFVAVVVRTYNKLKPFPPLIEDDDIEAVLLDFGRRYAEVAFHPDVIAITRLLIRDAPSFPELAKRMVPLGLSRAQTLLEAYLSAQMASGRIRTVPISIAAEAFIGGLRGHARSRLMLGLDTEMDPEEREARVHWVTQIFLRGMLVDAA